MSKIKDMFAEYNGDDDLVLSAQELVDRGMNAELCKRVIAYAKERRGSLIKALLEDADIVEGVDDEGHKEYSLLYKTECEAWASIVVDEYIEENTLDVSDTMWLAMNQHAYLVAMDIVDEKESEIVKMKMEFIKDNYERTIENEGRV